MARTEEEQAITEPFAAGLDYLLHDVGSAGVFADILLHLVKDDDRVRYPALERQGILQGSRELVGGDVFGFRELSAQSGLGFLFAGCEVRVGCEQRLGDQRADVEVAQLAAELTACCFDRSADLIIEIILLEPQAEARLGIALGEVG